MRRFSRWLPIGVLGAILGFLSMSVPAADADVDTEPSGDGLTLLDAGKFGLEWKPIPASRLNPVLQDAKNAGAGPYNPGAVLSGTGHSLMKRCSTSDSSLPLNPLASQCWAWDPATKAPAERVWSPQGITTSGDADSDGDYGGHRVIVSGWHYDDYNNTSTRDNDGRVAIIDSTPTSDDRLKYKWAYLIDAKEPAASDYTGPGDFIATKTHTGGMAWYGRYLFMTGQGNGAVLKVFDMENIIRMDTGSGCAGKIGKLASGLRCTYQYEYAIPLIGWYDTTTTGDCADGQWVHRTGRVCFSSISLDRSTSPVSLATTEYRSYDEYDGKYPTCEDDPNGQCYSAGYNRARLVRYPFGSTYAPPGEPVPHGAGPILKHDGTSTGRGIVHEMCSYWSKSTNQQGILSQGGNGSGSCAAGEKWWSSASWGNNFGKLALEKVGSRQFTTCANTPSGNCWSLHPEAVTYNVNTKDVWSQTECPEGNPTVCTGARRIFAVPLSRFPS